MMMPKGGSSLEQPVGVVCFYTVQGTAAVDECPEGSNGKTTAQIAACAF